MNSFGRLFRVTIFGESHGACVGLVIDGCPAGLPLNEADFITDIERRKGGSQKGTTPRKEDDLPIFKSGLFNGKTTGAPLTIVFENNNTRSEDYSKQRDFPRPGHADFVANKKFNGYEDYRGGGHFSGRLTVCMVGAGVVAKKILSYFSNNAITVTSKILEIGGETNLDAGLNKAIEAKDSIGGIVDCTVTNLPIGLGEPFFDSVESVMSHAVFAIPAIKGIEFGAGFSAAKMYGSQHNDMLQNLQGETVTNHAGGVTGGISTGNNLYFKIAVKPTSSTPLEQSSLNWNTNNIEKFSIKGRHDLCIALRVPPVLEAVAAMVVTDLMMLENKITRTITKHIYHVTTLQEWKNAKEQGAYAAPSLATEGFIHTSQKHQVAGVLERYYKNVPNLLLLTIDTAKLTNLLKYELAPSINEEFPHVYGTINIDAVVNIDII